MRRKRFFTCLKRKRGASFPRLPFMLVAPLGA
jgi:hypothetical protein